MTSNIALCVEVTYSISTPKIGCLEAAKAQLIFELIKDVLQDFLLGPVTTIPTAG